MGSSDHQVKKVYINSTEWHGTIKSRDSQLEEGLLQWNDKHRGNGKLSIGDKTAKEHQVTFLKGEMF